LQQRFDLSDDLFVEDALDGFAVFGFGDDQPTDKDPPYAAKDILIVSDPGLGSVSFANGKIAY
jgi:hypothetical protein